MCSTPHSIFIVYFTEYLTVYVTPELIFWYSASNSKYAICSPSCLLSLGTLCHYLQFWLRVSELFYLFPGWFTFSWDYLAASPGFFHTLHSTIPRTWVFQRFLLRSTGSLAHQLWFVFCFSTHYLHSTVNPSSCLLDMTTEKPFSFLELNQCRPELVTMMLLTALASSHSPRLINY